MIRWTAFAFAFEMQHDEGFNFELKLYSMDETMGHLWSEQSTNWIYFECITWSDRSTKHVVWMRIECVERNQIIWSLQMSIEKVMLIAIYITLFHITHSEERHMMAFIAVKQTFNYSIRSKCRKIRKFQRYFDYNATFYCSISTEELWYGLKQLWNMVKFPIDNFENHIDQIEFIVYLQLARSQPSMKLWI